VIKKSRYKATQEKNQALAQKKEKNTPAAKRRVKENRKKAKSLKRR